MMGKPRTDLLDNPACPTALPDVPDKCMCVRKGDGLLFTFFTTAQPNPKRRQKHISICSTVIVLKVKKYKRNYNKKQFRKNNANSHPLSEQWASKSTPFCCSLVFFDSTLFKPSCNFSHEILFKDNRVLGGISLFIFLSLCLTFFKKTLAEINIHTSPIGLSKVCF